MSTRQMSAPGWGGMGGQERKYRILSFCLTASQGTPYCTTKAEADEHPWMSMDIDNIYGSPVGSQCTLFLRVSHFA